MKIIYTIFVLFLAPIMCSNNAFVPKYFKAQNVIWNNSDNVFILVRHAEKQKGDDPHLTDDGVVRSQKLAFILDGINEMDIYSSDYNRTKETIEPLCEKMNAEGIIYNARELNEFSELLLAKDAGINVIAGHSNTTPTLANKLCNCSVFPKIDESDYTNIYVVVQSDSLSRTYVLNY